MKEQKIFHAVTNVSDKHIDEARNTPLKKKLPVWKKVTAIAACAAVGICAAAIPAFTGGNTPISPVAEVISPKAFAFDDRDAQMEIWENNRVEPEFLAQIHDFTFETASRIAAGQTENVNYSPLSLYYALSLAASGADGETAEELFEVLGVSDGEMLSEQCGNLYRLLYRDNEIGKLKIANSLWLDEKAEIHPEFAENAAENFYAESYQVDFGDKETGEAMGKWVADHTGGAIAPAIETDAAQLLSILNTVYFADEWIDRFDESATKADVFHLADGTEITCDFMNQNFGSAPFAKGENFTRASLGLKNSGSMVFVLPEEGVSVNELTASPEALTEAFEGGENLGGEVVWKIPKFDFSSKLELSDLLKAMGAESAFAEDADFSKITEQMAFIQSVTQETHIAIDEKGVEAAAFTSIDYAGAMPPADKAEMILDRPFLYGVTASDGTLLFVGVCNHPGSQPEK